jgi:hypothetical protein
MVPWSLRILTCLTLLLSSAAQLRAQETANLEITAIRPGFNNVYKLGCWTPIEVELQGGADAYTGVVEVITRDPDGVPTSVFTPRDRPVGITPGQPASARLFFRPGQDGSSVDVRFLDDTGRERAKRSFIPAPEGGGDYIPYGRPATNRLVATFGFAHGISEITRGETSPDDSLATSIVRIQNAADLPLEWYGYEALDTLVLSGNQPELYRPLAAGSQRIAALNRWVEQGGKLVLFCGANAPELLGPGGPLETLVPGKYDTLAPLREWQPIEAFSRAETALPTTVRVEVPKLAQPEGRILAFAGQNPTDLPLVIRARHGMGQITFVAVDPDITPLNEWQGRTALVRQALNWPAPAPGQSQENYNQQEDLMDRLGRALDESFADVRTAPFGLVALLVVIYILLIGPGDYFFVKRVLKRMELTWLTFPLIVMAVSAAAYWAAHYMKGNQLRVNQVEVIDVDVDAGKARGTVWTNFFSPHVQRYDLRLQPHYAEKPVSNRSEVAAATVSPDDAPNTLVAWLGSSGYGLDGMRGRRGQTGLFDRGYRFSQPLDAVYGLPVQEWSTKSLVGRWSAPVDARLVADLNVRDDELLAGHLTNHTGLELEDCVLLHANWAYALPNLPDGGAATIDDTLQPSSVKTALTAGGAEPPNNQSPSGPPRLRTDTLDIPQLATAMMFHEAVGGANYAQSPNRYQSFIDLSHLLNGDQAILLARASAATGSNWTTDKAPLATDQDRRWVYYRFIIPLKKAE